MKRLRRDRLWLWLACAVTVLSLVSCSFAGSAAKDVRAVSVARLCEQTELNEDRANELLDLLESLAYTGEVLFAYPATDDEGEEYYHVWIGEQTVDVYVAEDGGVHAVRSRDIWLYGEAADGADTPTPPPPQETEAPEEPQQPQEVTSQEEPGQPQQSSAPEEPEEPEESEQPDLPPVEATLSAVILTDTVAQGDKASLEAYGCAGEQYRIEVHYKSGVSAASGLEEQTAAEDGRLLWTWTVGVRTEPGDYYVRVVRVSDERDAVETPFTVVEKEK